MGNELSTSPSENVYMASTKRQGGYYGIPTTKDFDSPQPQESKQPLVHEPPVIGVIKPYAPTDDPIEFARQQLNKLGENEKPSYDLYFGELYLLYRWWYSIKDSDREKANKLSVALSGLRAAETLILARMCEAAQKVSRKRERRLKLHEKQFASLREKCMHSKDASLSALLSRQNRSKYNRIVYGKEGWKACPNPREGGRKRRSGGMGLSDSALYDLNKDAQAAIDSISKRRDFDRFTTATHNFLQVLVENELKLNEQEKLDVKQVYDRIVAVVNDMLKEVCTDCKCYYEDLRLLREQARYLGIPRYTRMSKSQLRRAIRLQFSPMQRT